MSSGISIAKVGHIVLKVENLDRALGFYCGVLGLKEVARRDFGQGTMAFLSTGDTHHDVALVEIGEGATVAPDTSIGMHHVALKVGDSLEQLALAKQHVEAHGTPVHMVLDHRVSQGMYVSDPDGNLLELYVDADEAVWRADPTVVANSDPIEL